MDFIQLMAADCEDLMPIIRFIKLGVLPIIQIGIPIILIVMGTIDLGKAVASMIGDVGRNDILNKKGY